MHTSISKAVTAALRGKDPARAHKSSVAITAGAFAALLTSSLASFGTAAAADEGASTTVLGEVLVTARYHAEDLQKTPIALTAVSGEQMAERGYRNILDISNTAPNVTLQNATAGRGKSAQAFIRGVGQGDFNYAYEPGVGFYIDDVYYATVFGSIFELQDVDRVEVLRGPQGTLFGKSSEGGAVRFYSRKPQGDNTGFLEVGTGRFNAASFKGAVDLPLVDNSLYMRLSGGWKVSDGYMDRLDYVCLHPSTSGTVLKPIASAPDCKMGTLGGEDVKSLRAAFRWLPTEGLEVNFIADYLDDNGEPAPQQVIAFNPTPAFAALTSYNNTVLVPFYGIPADSRFVSPSRFSTYATFVDHRTGLDFPDVSTVRSWGLSNSVDWDTGWDFHLKSITAFRAYTGNFSSDQALGPFALSLNYNTVAHHQFTQEFQFSGKAFGDALEWTGGLYYFNGYSYNGGYIDIPYTGRPAVTLPTASPAGFGLFFIQGDPATNINKSVFLHTIYHATDRLSVEAGVRYSKETKDYTYYRWQPNLHIAPYNLPANVYPTNLGYSLFAPGDPNPTGSAPTSSVDPKLGVQFQWTSDIMTYAQFGTGYKSGGTNPRPTIIPDDILQFGKETVSTYEVGAKTEWLGNRVRLNVDTFYSKYKDLQTVATTVNAGGTTSAKVYNLGRVRITGWEAELQAEPLPDWNINATWGYLDYKIDDLGNINGVPGGPNINAKPVLIPKTKWNVGTQYAIGLGALGWLTPRVDYTWQSKVYNDAANREDNAQPAYGVLNARLGWSNTENTWSAALNVANATDEEYYLTRAATSGLLEGQPARPRTWSFNIKKSFR